MLVFRGEMRYNFTWEGSLVYLLFPLVSGVIAWRWHLLGGALLIFLSAFYIVWIAYTIVTYPLPIHVEAMPRMIVLGYLYLIMLPFLIALAVGGVLHLIVGWKDRRWGLNVLC